MKLTLAALAAVGAIAAAAPVAAQSWAPINARQAMLDARIDAGVRDGSLTAGEAVRLRNDFRDLSTMEARYRASGGLQDWERADLNRRFDQLSGQIRVQRADNQVRGQSSGGWQSISQRQDRLDRRIEVGLRNGTITRREARRLRAEFDDIAGLEARYRTNGLSNWERADLDRRFDRLSAMIRSERADNQFR